jgi:hypothetical protein
MSLEDGQNRMGAPMAPRTNGLGPAAAGGVLRLIEREAPDGIRPREVRTWTRYWKAVVANCEADSATV